MIPAATHFCRSRYPALAISQETGLEPGVQVAAHANHAVAANGDLVGGFEADVDLDSALVGPTRLFPAGRGELAAYGGGFGQGGFAEAGAVDDPARGFARGPFAGGPFGVGAGAIRWESIRAWRDGVYRIVTRLLDWLGNAAATPAADVVVRVEALPRPPSRLRVTGAADGAVQFAFDRSPEFVLES